MRLLTGALVVLCCAASWAAEPPRYQGPQAVAAASDGRTLFVAAVDAREVLWLGLPGGNVVRRVAVPGEPTALAVVPGGRLAVAAASPQSRLLIFDVSTGRQLASIPVGHTASVVAISPDGCRAYVCNRFNNDVSVVDLAAGREIQRVPAVREPIAAAITPDGQTVLVANHLPDCRTDNPEAFDIAAAVTVIDARTLGVTHLPLAHGANGVRAICVTPDGRYALVTHLLSNFQKVPFRVDMGWINTNVVAILDIRNRSLVRTVGMDDYDLGAGNPWGIACTADGKQVCVALSGIHQLAMIELETLLGTRARTMSPMMGVWPIYPSLANTLWRRIALPGKGPRGIAAVGDRVYVTEHFSDAIAVVDPAVDGSKEEPDLTRCVKGSIPLGPPPQWTPERRGELAFHDATLCYQKWQSCASCHPDGRIDGLTWDLMNDGAGNPKSTKSMLFAHRTPPAMAEAVRMNAEDAVRAGLTHILFTEEREEPLALDMDAYLKTLRPVPSPYLLDGRLSPAAERGKKLFESSRIGCARCHPGPLFTDMKSHDVGTRASYETTRHFDTPTLVEVWRTAPYLHDGRYRTIRELLSKGKHGLSDELEKQELDDLVEFVLSL